MTECGDSSGATVYYTFAGGAERQYLAEQCPITVQVSTTPRMTALDFNPNGAIFNFAFKYYQTDGIQGQGFALLGLEDAPGGGPKSSIPVILGFNYLISRAETGTSLIYLGSSPYAPPAGNPRPRWNRCTIQVFHEGNLIFSDQGPAPCHYRIKCDCEEGELRIPSAEPPGYECFPIRRVRQRIEAIKNDFDQHAYKE